MVVNNAGFGISGAIEFTKTEDAKRLLTQISSAWST